MVPISHINNVPSFLLPKIFILLRKHENATHEIGLVKKLAISVVFVTVKMTLNDEQESGGKISLKCGMLCDISSFFENAAHRNQLFIYLRMLEEIYTGSHHVETDCL